LEKVIKILIIDDDIDLGRLLVNCLMKKDYQPTYVENGILGLEKMKTIKFDLIILDIMLPEIDGFSVMKSIREISNIPVLMLTAKSEERDKVKGLQLGADDYLTKPFGIDEFLARVNSIIRRANYYNQQMEKGIIKYGNIELNSYCRTLKVNSEEIPLSNKEFDLLLLLMANKNQIFTKEQLYNQIWGFEGYDSYDEKNMVSFISKLRKKVFYGNEEYGGFIETVYGLGYRWRIK
jgi:DNA-binding response OmpR family regulator